MTIRIFENRLPDIPRSAFVDETALVLGDVLLGEDASVWPTAVLRGDIHSIVVGARSNIQDGSVLHVTHDSEYAPGGHGVSVGKNVTVGHRVVLHGCTVEDYCLVGMGSVVLDGAVVRSRAMVGAGSLVPPGKDLEGGYLWLGSPVKRMRPLTDKELGFLDYSAAHYVELKNRHQRG
jgi:carbonic anhydrase/acetyltransferase-like protein (isoleucine patch superfamily)